MDKHNDKKNTFIEYYIRNNNISKSCEEAGISRSTYYRYYNEDIEFKDRVDDVREAMIDKAESKLMDLVERGHFLSIQLLLKSSRAKARGFGSDAAVITKTDNDITISF